MKVLLSAFSCAPGIGSEYGVGWNWTITLAEIGYDVTVLTHRRNRSSIERMIAEAPHDHLRFIYISLFPSDRVPGFILLHYLYYYAWQVKALFVVLRRGIWKRVDIVHHLTYGGIRTGSLLFLVPKPFIFGPVGGGETCPMRLVSPLGVVPFGREAIRRLFNTISFVDPIFVLMQARAKKLFVRTIETGGHIWPIFRGKMKVASDIGSSFSVPRDPVRSRHHLIRVLFAGNLYYFKGVDVVADAMKILDSRGPGYRLTIAGEGPRRSAVQEKLNLFRNTPAILLGRVPQSTLFSLYQDTDVFVFPSYHDSGGTVILEAMSFGTPVVCLDLGGPPHVAGTAGIVISVTGRSYAEVCSDVAEAIERLASTEGSIDYARRRSLERARELTWEHTVRSVYDDLEK